MNKLITDTIASIDNDDIKELYAPILDCIIKAQHSIDDFDSESITDALAELECSNDESDFTFDFDGAEYRIIHKDVIDISYQDAIQELVESCYELNLDKIPAFIVVSIDWEQTAQNALIDGYGHTFSSYDGSEEFVNGWYIFRTN